MFEDDLDIDEILDSCESTSLKRTNNDIHTQPSCKKPKISPISNDENAINTSIPSKTKKIFRFKKKETFQDIISTGAIESNVNNTISSPTARNSSESEENKVKEIVRNCTTIESNRSTQVQEHRTQPTSRFTEKLDQCSKLNDETTSSIPKKIAGNADTSFQNDRSIGKRKFPGPAGLLPERNFNNFSRETINESSEKETKIEVCSQSSSILFNEEPWERMMSDYSTQEIALPEKYTIQWIKSRALMKKLINQKAPFLAALVDSIRSHSIQNPIVNLVLKDKTGTIQGTILHNLYEEHSGNLTVGSVIVLKDLGVLNTGQNDDPYLTITRNNLISIYTNKKQIEDVSTQTSISKIILQNLDATEILNKIIEKKKLHKLELTNTCNSINNISLTRRDIKGPTNFSETFRKVVRNVKSPSSPKPPNLGVLRINSTVRDNAVKLTENPSCSKKENEKIEDLMGFFDSQEGIEEFFNDKPNFCSTQKGSPIKQHLSDPKPETCSVEIQDSDKIFEDMLEGVDANALFDEF